MLSLRGHSTAPLHLLIDQAISHEAAHAAMALFLGRPIERIVIENADDLQLAPDDDHWIVISHCEPATLFPKHAPLDSALDVMRCFPVAAELLYCIAPSAAYTSHAHYYVEYHEIDTALHADRTDALRLLDDLLTSPGDRAAALSLLVVEAHAVMMLDHVYELRSEIAGRLRNKFDCGMRASLDARELASIARKINFPVAVDEAQAAARLGVCAALAHGAPPAADTPHRWWLRSMLPADVINRAKTEREIARGILLGVLEDRDEHHRSDVLQQALDEGISDFAIFAATVDLQPLDGAEGPRNRYWRLL